MNRSLAPERLAALVGDFSRSPAYRGLRLAIQGLIGDGRIPINTRLPSERAVTEILGVSRNTVTRAYSDLVTAGYANTQRGAGTYTTVPFSLRHAHDHTLHSLETPGSPANVINLSRAADAATQGVGAAYKRAMEKLPTYLRSDGYLPRGLPILRAVIADLYARRGIPTSAEEIMITSGALSAISIVARALSRPGDRVMVESPVYANAIEALRFGGGRLVSSPLSDPLGEEGWDIEGIQATLRQTSPRIAYVIPDFQNPTGFLMSNATRARYASVLHAARTIPVIDETLQPLSLTDDQMPNPFGSHSPEAITIGSASKTYWGGLRVGWIRASRQNIDTFIKARLQHDLGSSLFDQIVVTELLSSPEILAERLGQLRERRDALARALENYLPKWRFRLPKGGLTLWVQLPYGSATRLSSNIEHCGVHVAPGPSFSVDGGSDAWIRIPFAKPETELIEAIKRIAERWTLTSNFTTDANDTRKHFIT